MYSFRFFSDISGYTEVFYHPSMVFLTNLVKYPHQYCIQLSLPIKVVKQQYFLQACQHVKNHIKYLDLYSYYSSLQDRFFFQVLDTETCEEIYTFVGHFSSIRDCCLSKDGVAVVTCSDDATVKVNGKKLTNQVVRNTISNKPKLAVRCLKSRQTQS